MALTRSPSTRWTRGREPLTAYSTRNVPSDSLQLARLLARARGVTLEHMIADALAIGLDAWAEALTVRESQSTDGVPY